MDDPVTVSLESAARAAHAVALLIEFTTAAIGRIGGIGREGHGRSLGQRLLRDNGNSG